MSNRRQVLVGLGSAAVGLAAPATLLRADPTLPGVRFLKPNDNFEPKDYAAYNAELMKVPRLRALCDSRDGVANCVRWAREEGLSFAVRSTGHDFRGHSQHEGLVIDTSPLNQVKLANDSVVVGAGTHHDQLYTGLGNLGRAIGGGTHGSVGIAGLTLGGGFGHFTRQAGLACDQLQSLRLVDAKGDIRFVSAQDDADLFWACRGGGGGSFGVVTDLTFQTLDVPELTYIAAPVWVNPDEAYRILREWHGWNANLPRAITTHLSAMPYTGGMLLLALSGMSTLPFNQTRKLVDDFLGANRPARDGSLRSGDADTVMQQLYGSPHWVSALRFLSRSHILPKAPDDAVFRALLSVLYRLEPTIITLNFESLGGAVDDVGGGDTAFPHRGAASIVHYTKTLQGSQQAEPARQALAAVMKAMAPAAGDGIYVNYPEPERVDWQQAYWGDNLDRLKRIKGQTDPDNLFNHAQSVPVG